MKNSKPLAEEARSILEETPLIDIEIIDCDDVSKNRFYESVKRFFDLSFGLCAQVVLMPVMVLAAISIKRDSTGPVVFRQERLGLHGAEFTIFKFRTMYIDAESDGAHWTEVNDPRITRVGRILRSSHLDELPQLWNVIKGDMSLVGPRPERGVFYPELEARIHGFSQRLLVKPGITGLAQVSGGYDLSSEEKIKYDIEYIKHRSLLLDLQILIRTIGVFLTGEGAR